MFSDSETSTQNQQVKFPTSNTNLAFSEYLRQTRDIIKERRNDLHSDNAQAIIDANMPFELRPLDCKQVKTGVLMLHGLLDCPFSLREIGYHLQKQNHLVRSLLLPGHGTRPSDLMNISYHDWIQALRYGVESIHKEVDDLYLIGYSTGATLSVYEALHDEKIKGIILLSPAIKIKAPIDSFTRWHQLVGWLTHREQWVRQEPEIDYAKYKSIAFNGVMQVAKLTIVLREMLQKQKLHSPIDMILSREDETVSSDRAMDFFSNLHHEKSQMLLYTSIPHPYPDKRIEPRIGAYPDRRIKHLSHSCLPFSETNSHYGLAGNFEGASHPNRDNVIYGAYNGVERKIFNNLYDAKLLKKKRLSLTYNPDFHYMCEHITNFIEKTR